MQADDLSLIQPLYSQRLSDRAERSCSDSSLFGLAWAGALPLVWLFNIVGTVDLLNALRQNVAIAHLGAAWYIPTFLVPVLLVTHFMMFAWLLRRGR